ncbi:hypothetical protein ABK040_007540 [Willaertia magna]
MMHEERGYKAKDEDEILHYPFEHLEKTQVLQETRIFNDTPLNTRKCVLSLLQLLYILGQGNNLNSTEATEVFMNITKLFFSTDIRLRRIVYIAVKELSKIANQTFVASNSLFKDMSQNQNEEFKINAIRALRTIMDENLFGNLDRHLKQCVVDKNAGVASAAILAGFHLSDSPKGEPLVKRWAGEIQSAMDSRFHMVQYHALALMYKLRREDGLAISKIVSSGIQNLRSPLAHTLLIKYAMRVIRMEGSLATERSKTILKYLETCLKFRNDMVILEAAKALISLKDLSPKEISPAVVALQNFLTSSKSVKRFAAVRMLNELANRMPTLVGVCNNDLDRLINDGNRNIATLAITTLLKTGTESGVDKLMKRISRFISEIPDEFKVVVVKSIEVLCLKYPKKYHAMIAFLSNALRTEGGYEYKKQIVNCLIMISKNLSETRDLVVLNLCEFIEDCEYTLLLQQVLHFLGEEGTNTSNPSKCIRYIYNRLILENPSVRGSAVISIAKFAAKIPSLKQSVLVILRRTLLDSDDEVRDRAVFYLKVLETGDEDLIKKLIINELPENLLQYYYSVEKSLVSYLQSTLDEPFDLTDVQMVEPSSVVNEAENIGLEGAISPNLQFENIQKESLSPSVNTTSAISTSNETIQEFEQVTSKIPLLQKLGKPFKTCAPIALTEPDSDYVVSCVTYIFEKEIVLQFLCKNKVEAQQLSNLVVDIDLDEIEGVNESFKIQAESAIKFNQSESTFIVLTRDNPIVSGKIPCVLRFNVAEIDTETGEPYEEEDEVEDDFDLEPVTLKVTDFIRSVAISSSFKEEWDKIGEEHELNYQPIEYSTNDEDLQTCVDKFIQSIGLPPINDRKVTKKTHALYFVGKSLSGDMAYIAAQLGEKNNAILLKLSVRCENDDLRTLIGQQLSQ